MSQTDAKTDIDPHLKEQNEGIFYAFSVADYKVLTTSEIADQVDIEQRTVLRRLKKLQKEGIVGSRKPGRTRLWWLEAEVEEPASVKYPIIRLIQRRLSLQFVVIGIAIGAAAVILITTSLFTAAWDISPPFISNQRIIQAGLIASFFSALFFLSAAVVAGTGWLFDRLGIEIRYNPDD